MMAASSGQLQRRLRRLAEMPPVELSYRVRESARRGIERAAHRFGRRPEQVEERLFLERLPAAARGSLVDFLRTTVAQRSALGGEQQRRELVKLARISLAERLGDIASEAKRLCEHRFEILGFGETAADGRIDWHRDPVSGARWPRRFWADYDLVHEGPADPKRVLELSRHQHLPRLGKAYLLLGEERFAEEAVAQLCSWIDDNPRGTGIHWHESLEIALRALSWMWTLLFLQDSAALAEPPARRIGASLFRQLDHIDAHPSLYTSPNTHLLGEATALFVAGVLFRGCEGAERWLEHGRRLLGETAERQILDDGVHAELSTGYHCYALDFYLQALALAARNQVELPGHVRPRVAAMARFLVALQRGGAPLPKLGDDDGGRALALAGTRYFDGADLLCSAALLFGDSSLRSSFSGWREEALWLLGEHALRDWEKLPPAPRPARRSSFPDAGYFVLRAGKGRQEAHLTFDCGGLGRPSGGHGHADALSITLAAGAAGAAGMDELLVDPGTYVYNGKRHWRDAFRGTAAHNTVVVDRLDQVEPADTFRWQRELDATLLADLGFGDLTYLAGEHRGYARRPTDLVHRRRLIHPGAGTWFVLDDFRGGDATHTFELPFHLSPGARVDSLEQVDPTWVSARVVVGSSALRLSVLATAPLELTLRRGGAGAPLAWVSDRYGARRAAPVLVARYRDRAPALVLTVLETAPSGDASPFASRTLRRLVDLEAARSAPAVGIALEDGAGTDVVVLSDGAGEVAFDLPRRASRRRARGRGGAFWARLESAGSDDGARTLRRWLAIDATCFEVEDVMLLRCDRPGTVHGDTSDPIEGGTS